MKRLMWVGLLLLCCSGQLRAAEQTEQMDDVVVTATRTSIATQNVGGASVTVIGADEIEALHVTTVVDVLRSVPGLQITSNGGMGSQSSVFIRGADSKNTLLLIDGISANDPSGTNRGADLSNISVDNIERIEVVRGAMSVLYGSNATAGVINIITKPGTQDFHGYVGAQSGSYSSHKLYGGLTGSAGISDFSVSLSRLTTQGYSLADADNKYIPHAGNTSEDDGWENTTCSAKVSLDLCPNASITAVVRYSDAQMDNDDWFWGGYAGDRFDTVGWTTSAAPNGRKKAYTDSEKFFGGVNMHNQFAADKFVSDLDYKYSRQKRSAYDNDDNPYYDYLGTVDEWSWQGVLAVVPDDFVTVGIGCQTETMDSSYATEDTDADTTSYWVQNQFIAAGFDVVAGLRYDDHDRFGGKTTWRVAPAYHVEAIGTTLRASYAAGFRAPSLSELYGPWGPNKDLDPEKSRSWDVGIEQKLLAGDLTCAATYFNMKFEDRIDWDSSRIVPGALWSGGYAQFDGTSRTSGVELTASWQVVEGLLFSADYTYTDTEETDGARMKRRPLNKVHASLCYNFIEAATVNVDAYWYDEREASSYARDAQGNTVATLDDYFLVNLAANYDLTDMLRIYARIDNLFDEHYEEAWSYATPGQSFYVGAKLTF